MKKAVIFDLDGTLLYTLETIAHHCNTALRKYNLTPIAPENYVEFIGVGAFNLIHSIIAKEQTHTVEFDEIYSYYMRCYTDNVSYLTRPYEGVMEMLAVLKDKSIKTAILSNKPHSLTAKISEIFFKDTIDLTYGQRQGIPLKPDPAALLEIIRELSLTADQCIFVGDNSVDIKCGKNAGTKTVGVAWGFEGTKPFAFADKIVKTPYDIIDLL